MTRRHTLTWIAISSTSLLWAATVATAFTELGTERLYAILLVGSFLAGVATMLLLKMLVVDARLRDIRGELRNALNQAADELHTAVGEAGEVLRQDRAAIVAVRALTAELVHARAIAEKHDQSAF